MKCFRVFSFFYLFMCVFFFNLFLAEYWLNYKIKERQLLTQSVKISKELLELANSYEVQNRKLEKEILSLKCVKVKVTAYTARKEECNEDPGNTALMRKPTPGRTVAVSRDLKHLLNKEIYIKGVDVRVVEDLMHPRFESSIDILVPSVKDARSFGVMESKLIVIS